MATELIMNDATKTVYWSGDYQAITLSPGWIMVEATKAVKFFVSLKRCCPEFKKAKKIEAIKFCRDVLTEHCVGLGEAKAAFEYIFGLGLE